MTDGPLAYLVRISAETDSGIAYSILESLSADVLLTWVVEEALIEDIPDLLITFSPEIRIASEVLESGSILVTMRPEVAIVV